MAKGQIGFVETMVDPRLGRNARLDRIEAQIDWRALRPALAGLRSGEVGRPPFDALAMVKALYLQRLYDLSDAGLEEALLDRVSFRRFCGFGLEARTPDETTFVRLRQDAAKAGTLERCFEAINAQLEARGLILKKGTLMDATLIAAAHNPPPFEAGGGRARHPKDPNATFTRKNGKSHFGFKGHIGADETSLIVRRAAFTANVVNDSEAADGLISGDERAVYADKAYPQKARRARLKAAGIKDRIMTRRHKHQPALDPRRARLNQLIARRRAPVEGVFSCLKRIYGQARARCHSLERAAADFFAAVTVYNLTRAAKITI